MVPVFCGTCTAVAVPLQRSDGRPVCRRCHGLDLHALSSPRAQAVLHVQRARRQPTPVSRGTVIAVVVGTVVLMALVGTCILSSGRTDQSSSHDEPPKSGMEKYDSRAGRRKFAEDMSCDLRSGSIIMTTGGPEDRSLDIQAQSCGTGLLEEMRRSGMIDQMWKAGFRNVTCAWEGNVYEAVSQ